MADYFEHDNGVQGFIKSVKSFDQLCDD